MYIISFTLMLSFFFNSQTRIHIFQPKEKEKEKKLPSFSPPPTPLSPPPSLSQHVNHPRLAELTAKRSASQNFNYSLATIKSLLNYCQPRFKPGFEEEGWIPS